MRRKFLLGLAFAVIAQVAAAFAQEPAVGTTYTVGPQDVLVITSYDLQELENGDLSQNVRLVDGRKKEIAAQLDDFVEPRDTIVVHERFF